VVPVEEQFRQLSPEQIQDVFLEVALPPNSFSQLIRLIAL